MLRFHVNSGKQANRTKSYTIMDYLLSWNEQLILQLNVVLKRLDLFLLTISTRGLSIWHWNHVHFIICCFSGLDFVLVNHFALPHYLYTFRYVVGLHVDLNSSQPQDLELNLAAYMVYRLFACCWSGLAFECFDLEFLFLVDQLTSRWLVGLPPTPRILGCGLVLTPKTSLKFESK